MNSKIASALASLSLLAAASHAFADVIVVDSSGAGDFTQIQPAIDAASDGDTILVESGTYSRFRVNDRDLVIVGDIGAAVRIDGTIEVSALGVEKVLVLQNLATLAPYPSAPGDQHGISLHDDLGRVRIQSCSFAGAAAAHCARVNLNGGDGVRSRNCADVALIACTGRGGRGATDGNFTYGAGGSGVFAAGCVLTVYDSFAIGGPGGQCDDGTYGGHGMKLSSDALLVGAHYQALAGNGSNSCAGCGCSYGGSGGYGTVLLASSQAFPLNVVSQGGTGGTGNSGFGCTNTHGQPGQPYYISSDSTLSPFAGSARVMTAASPVHAGTTLSLALSGNPGDAVTLFVSDLADARFVPDWSGTLLLDPRAPHGTSTQIGTIPSSGALVAPFVVDDPGTSSKTLYLQPLFTDASGGRILGSPWTVVVLQ